MITYLLVLSVFPPSSYTCLVRLYFDVGHSCASRSQVFDVAHSLPAYDLFTGDANVQFTKCVQCQDN
jgi:hypothetical protein